MFYKLLYWYIQLYIYILYLYIRRYVNLAFIRVFLIEFCQLCFVMPFILCLIKSADIPYLNTLAIELLKIPDIIIDAFTRPEVIEEFLDVNNPSDLKNSDVIEVGVVHQEGKADVSDGSGKADVSDGKKKGDSSNLVGYLLYFTCGVYIIGYLAYCSQFP